MGKPFIYSYSYNQPQSGVMTQKSIMPLDLKISCSGDTTAQLKHLENSCRRVHGTFNVHANMGLASLNQHSALKVAHTVMTNNVGFMSHNRAVSHLQTSELQLETCVVPVQHCPLQTGHFNSLNSRKK